MGKANTVTAASDMICVPNRPQPGPIASATAGQSGAIEERSKPQNQAPPKDDTMTPESDISQLNWLEELEKTKKNAAEEVDADL